MKNKRRSHQGGHADLEDGHLMIEVGLHPCQGLFQGAFCQLAGDKQDLHAFDAPARYTQRPPWTWRTVPVTYRAFSDTRKLTASATSLGAPNRPRGTIRVQAALSSVRYRSYVSVSMKPGLTALTLMPHGAS